MRIGVVPFGPNKGSVLNAGVGKATINNAEKLVADPKLRQR
jgi:hypothetical protein